MAGRFHFNPATGRTGKCAAQVQCRFGQSDDQHGATREEARANYERAMEGELFANTSSKTAGKGDEEVRETLVARQYYPNGNYSNYWKSKNAEAAATRVLLEDRGIATSYMNSDELTRSTWIALNRDGTRAVKGFSNRDYAEQEGYHHIIHRPDYTSAAQKLADGADRRTLDRMAEILEKENSWNYTKFHRKFNRYSEEELNEERANFMGNYGYLPGDLVEERGVTEEHIDSEEIDGRGFIVLKIPGGSETTMSTELARRELAAIEERRSNSRRGYGW